MNEGGKSPSTLQERLVLFKIPEGFELARVPIKTACRSPIYDYGVKCLDICSKKAKWFCLCDEICAFRSNNFSNAGIWMFGNSSTNCISHLRDCHNIQIEKGGAKQASVPPEKIELDEILENITRFVPPVGYTKDPVPTMDSRSVIYSYGCRCTNPMLQDTRWFCLSDASCAMKSMRGVGGISVKGNSSTNCLAHMRDKHGLTPLKAKKRKISDLDEVACTPSTVFSTVDSPSSISPILIKTANMNNLPSEVASLPFECPPGFTIDPHIPKPGPLRSNIYDYGRRCVNLTTKEVRWFCLASDTCIANSRAGIHSISMKGNISTNCSSHLRNIHGISPTSGARRRTATTKGTVGVQHQPISTPTSVTSLFPAIDQAHMHSVWSQPREVSSPALLHDGAGGRLTPSYLHLFSPPWRPLPIERLVNTIVSQKSV